MVELDSFSIGAMAPLETLRGFERVLGFCPSIFTNKENWRIGEVVVATKPINARQTKRYRSESSSRAQQRRSPSMLPKPCPLEIEPNEANCSWQPRSSPIAHPIEGHARGFPSNCTEIGTAAPFVFQRPTAKPCWY